jgi:hypothetical protein
VANYGKFVLQIGNDASQFVGPVCLSKLLEVLLVLSFIYCPIHATLLEFPPNVLHLFDYCCCRGCGLDNFGCGWVLHLILQSLAIVVYGWNFHTLPVQLYIGATLICDSVFFPVNAKW